ncbi:HAD family hydrolase [Acinetobacter variabilis]|uniref:HAD family hydrolase n=1 Tax=Acinetobacter variabilis TaxID=70346 RepID=UPI0021CD2851|nr:HAD family hydrolase [Acinetobacter variabilis]MCU4366616.1 HAD family hydrolase [Acinetobacter variabilis]MCU4376706.1 HAD family hydrolase [Acinetobacter variabilis]
MNHLPKVIIFDAFGTLVKIGTSRSPYRKLMKWLKANGRKPSTKDASVIMSNPVDIAQLAMLFGENIPTQLLHEINDDLLFELSTIELYKDTISTLQILKEQGFKIALCSNVAMPYGEQLKKLLPNVFDALFLSYEIGTIKPEDYIYEVIKTHFNCEMSEMLFIGDHPVLDVEKPISLGMDARLIQRHNKQLLTNVIGDLTLT